MRAARQKVGTLFRQPKILVRSYMTFQILRSKSSGFKFFSKVVFLTNIAATALKLPLLSETGAREPPRQKCRARAGAGTGQRPAPRGDVGGGPQRNEQLSTSFRTKKSKARAGGPISCNSQVKVAQPRTGSGLEIYLELASIDIS